MKKRFLAIFIVVMMLFSQITVFASVPDSSTTSINPEYKLTDELKEVMSNTPDGEYIPIYIWLNDDYSDELVYAHLSNKLGEEINGLNESAYISKRIEEKVEQYKTKQFSTQQRAATLSMQSAFENLSVESKISSLRNNADLSSIVTNEEIKNCLIDGKSFEDIIELSERYQYLSDYRDSRMAINESINSYFASLLNTESCKNITTDSLLSYVKLECEKDFINVLSAMKEVKLIGHNQAFEIIEDEESLENNTLNTNEHIVSPPNTTYTGSGIKIGVIEVGDYNDSASHLVGKNIISYNSSAGNATDLSHATKVLSIIIGENISIGNVEYQGIAPNATMYFGYTSNTDGNFPIFHWMIVENDVSVINLSKTFASSYGSYDNYTMYIDCLVQQYRVTIVHAAGNEGQRSENVGSPGYAYNIITVGNATEDLDNENKYTMRATSSFEEEDFFTNKPDISAFGTLIRMVYNGVESDYESGTSFAAPMVTGTVALMMQANSELIGKPDAIKAILVNTATDDITHSENAVVSNYTPNSAYSNISLWTLESQIRDRSGAGLLNIEGAISMAQSNVLYRFAMGRGSALEYNTKTIGEFYIEAGKTIEYTLVFENPYDNLIESLDDVNVDFEIELYKGSTLIMSSNSNVNNVESFRVTIPETGYYTFIVRCEKLNYNITDDDWNFEIDTSTGETEEHIQHNTFYATFVLSCGCDLPSMIESGCYSEGHDIECENCTFTCFEPHKVASLTQTNSYATVTYEIKYKFEQPIEGYGNMERVCYYGLSVTVTPTNSNHNGVAIIETGNSEIQPDGTTIETRTYWIMIRDNSTGATVTSFYSTVNYMYDPYVGAYYLY